MKNSQPKTGQFALIYGLILGAIGIAFSLMLYFMDLTYQQSWANSVVGIAILIAVVVIGIFQFKKANGGFLTLAQALKVGMGIALIGAVLSVLYTILFTSVIEPEFWQKNAEVAKAAMVEGGKMTPEQIDVAVKQQLDFYWVAYPIILIFNIFFGFVVALIAGLVMKKAPSEY